MHALDSKTKNKDKNINFKNKFLSLETSAKSLLVQTSYPKYGHNFVSAYQSYQTSSQIKMCISMSPAETFLFSF